MENDNKNIGFRANNEEIALIDQAAAELEMNRADYLRYRAIPRDSEVADSNPKTSNLDERLDRLEALIKHAIYTINQVYVGVFAIAEAEGKARRFLSIGELEHVHDQVRAEALTYAVQFPNSFAAVQAEITALAKNGAK
jgi:hypothetical protein